MITYNEAAIRFYEANGFRRLRILQGQPAGSPCATMLCVFTSIGSLFTLKIYLTSSRTSSDYYVIEGQRYASYLYIRYLNHAMDPKAVTWVDGLFRCVRRNACSCTC